MKIYNYQKHTEAKAYNGCSYESEGIKIIERTAKITPKKIGQFVTCWKRNIDGITYPFKETARIDFFIIKVIDGERSGEFKLVKHGILSTEKKKGKGGLESTLFDVNQLANKQLKLRLGN
jgi:hypothetical protein